MQQTDDWVTMKVPAHLDETEQVSLFDKGLLFLFCQYWKDGYTDCRVLLHKHPLYTTNPNEMFQDARLCLKLFLLRHILHLSKDAVCYPDKLKQNGSIPIMVWDFGIQPYYV